MACPPCQAQHGRFQGVRTTGKKGETGLRQVNNHLWDQVPPALTPGQREATTWTWVPALGYGQGDRPENKVVLLRAGCVEATEPISTAGNACPSSPGPSRAIPWFVHNLPQHPDCIIITHVLKVDLVYLGKGPAKWAKKLC